MGSSSKPLSSALFAGLTECLGTMGFSYRATRQAWVRRSRFGVFSAHANIARHPGEVGILVSANVRLDDVETLVKPGSKDTATIGTWLENLAGEQPLHYTVAAMSDVAPVVDKIMMLMRAFGEPFLMRHETPCAALELLLGDSRLAMQCAPLDDYRTMTVCALLKLEGRWGEAQDYLKRRIPGLRKSDRQRVVEFASGLAAGV